MKGEFLQLAKPLSEDVYVGGWFWSEKLDGHRCFWDGGATRGWKKKDVPWANIGKDNRFIKEQYATGLWSRYGHPIYAPDSLLDRLPVGLMMDGELYDARNREALAACVKRQDSLGDWASVEYRCFDAVSVTQFCALRTVEYGHRGYKVHADSRWREVLAGNRDGTWTHRTGLYLLGDWAWFGGELPQSDRSARSVIAEKMGEIVGRGGEGLMIRHPDREWTGCRSRWIRKVKPVDHGVGVVVGTVAGEGRHLGRIGGLIVEDNGIRFGIGTGLTDADREIEWIGRTVRYGHRGYSAAGVPIETRYLGEVT